MKNYIHMYAAVLAMLAVVVFGIHAGQAEEVAKQDTDKKKIYAARIVVHKFARKMELLDEQKNVMKTYKIALGHHPHGAKTREGDGKTPEGEYTIEAHNAKSSFYKSLKISYPNQADIAQARAQGVSPGGMIMIHGLPKGLGWIGRMHRMRDTWTSGCIAVTNKEIDEIFALVQDGTPIEIWP